MNNKYVVLYCNHYNLDIQESIRIPGENYITDKGERIGFYRNDSKYIEFNNNENEYKKSDLLSFILENFKAH